METDLTSDNISQNSKTIDEFYEAKEEFSASDEEEDEIFVDPSSDLDAFMDILINQRRNEITHELRNITDHSSNRSRLENWFQNTSIIRQFRSSDVQNEIAQLGSIRRVSNVLSTSRNRIESVLQNMIRTQPPPIVHPRPNEQIRQTQPLPIVQPGPNERIRQTQPRGENINEIVMAINQISREQVIEEISELVHRQLVSSSLQSDFRSVLEQRVVDHLNRIGTNGQQTREFIRSLPVNRNIIRNDFGDLRINIVDEDTESIESVISETRARRNTGSRDIKLLKNEIAELRNMVKLSFELQMDMQRSLKQEISALINGTFKDTKLCGLINTNRPVNSGKCIICTENDSDTVFYQCGHLCACYQCSMNLRQKSLNCPVCRAPIKDILRTYKCGHD